MSNTKVRGWRRKRFVMYRIAQYCVLAAGGVAKPQHLHHEEYSYAQ